MNQSKREDYAILANRIRTHFLTMVHQAHSSHIGSTFSIADLLAVLFGGVLQIDPARPDWPERDRFILSKDHATAGLYAALAERYFSPLQRTVANIYRGLA